MALQDRQRILAMAEALPARNQRSTSPQLLYLPRQARPVECRGDRGFVAVPSPGEASTRVQPLEALEEERHRPTLG